MALFSFDVESEYDKSELNNVLDQAQREIGNRYDFKNTPAAIIWQSNGKDAFVVTGNTEFQIDAIVEIVRKKLALRGQSQKCIDTSQEPKHNNLQITKVVPLVRGLNSDKAKTVSAVLRTELPKVKATIQGESVRVSSAKKDDLQQAMRILQAQDFNFPINFTNYR